jgi:hypothetical protein
MDATISMPYQTLTEKEYKNVDSEDFKNVHDLLAAILINQKPCR